jgi:hypothetical protein
MSSYKQPTHSLAGGGNHIVRGVKPTNATALSQ